MLQFRLCTLSARLCMLSARLCTLSLFVFSELCHGQFHKVPSFEILPGSVLAAERPKSFKTDFPSCSLVFGLLSLWASVLLSLSGGAHPSIRTPNLPKERLRKHLWKSCWMVLCLLRLQRFHIQSRKRFLCLLSMLRHPLLSSCQRQWPSLDVRQLQLPRRTLGLASGLRFLFCSLETFTRFFFATKDHVTYSIHTSSRLPQQLSPFHVLLLSF